MGGTKAPNAGLWWDEYVQMLVKNANPPIVPTHRNAKLRV